MPRSLSLDDVIYSEGEESTSRMARRADLSCDVECPAVGLGPAVLATEARWYECRRATVL